jgi:hypothetical protein
MQRPTGRTILTAPSTGTQSSTAEPLYRHRSNTGEEVRGPSPVRDYIVALHSNMLDARTRRIVVSDGHAYLEGDCVEAPTESSSRIFYCVAYDIVDGRITAMRCYGQIADMAPSVTGEI